MNGDTGYWEISSDANGENVISNGYPTGQFSVQVQTGQFLTLTDVTVSQ